MAVKETTTSGGEIVKRLTHCPACGERLSAEGRYHHFANEHGPEDFGLD